MSVKRQSRRSLPVPRLLWADDGGNIYDEAGWAAAGRRGDEIVRLDPAELIPLPEGSELFLLPARRPLGFPGPGAAAPYEKPRGAGEPAAVAAFLAPAYTQFLLPAYRTLPGAPLLPLFAYTAVCLFRGTFMVPAARIDPDPRQDPGTFDCDLAERGIERLLGAAPGNRLLAHLANCAREYRCPAALNLFQGRHEAPLPSSPACNAGCLGCISLQPAGCCPSTQERITFVPTPEELAEVALGHLARVPDGVVSFGQGCEGEPLLVADVLEEAVRLIRRRTSRGTVNLNTNASLPGAVAGLAAAGLDAIRVSLSSARPGCYEAYHRPEGYRFEDVRSSIRAASRAGVHVSLNYFVFPGVTDQPAEIEALLQLIGEDGVDFIQWRNLNIDPELYLSRVPAPPGHLGIPAVLRMVRERFPRIGYGYFNPPVGRAADRPSPADRGREER